jgi:23S rRNA (uracil1939-C5)-methyltransferase
MVERATITLTDMAHGGDAVGAWQGQAVFVPFGLAGEEVAVELLPGGPRFLRGRLLEVLTPSPERVAPPCPYYGVCGGCDWQHMAYPAQLAAKARIVESVLRRIGRQAAPRVLPAIGMDAPWAYRNHVQLRVNRQGQVGYYAHASHDVVSVGRCAIAHPLVDDLWGALDVQFAGLRRIALRAGHHTGDQMVILEGRGATPPLFEADMPVSCLYWSDRGEVTVMSGASFLREELLGRAFQVSGPSFFQNNTVQAERAIAVAARYLALQPGETLLDAYCGVGALAFSLATAANPVIGIEGSPWAVIDAEANAIALLGEQADVTLIEADVEEALMTMELAFDAAVLDPPRGGCTPEALHAMAQRQPGRMVYVSCDPATLARDIAVLAGLGYVLREVQPVDLFPQTHHIECVALLEREHRD